MRVKTFSPLRPNTFHPPRGETQVYLPNFTITLLHTPHAPPHFASFLTPLHLNKLDLKDYLYHGYGLQVLNVRSYVIQAKVQTDQTSKQNKWFRPRATKKMTVELVQDAPGQGPFVWPDPPKDFTPWSKKSHEAREKHQEESREKAGPHGDRVAPKDGETLAEQAKALREGRARWRPGWEDYGGARVLVRGGRELGEGVQPGEEYTESGWTYGRKD